MSRARISAKEVADRLALQIEPLCRFLLPNGKREAGEWCVGSVGGEAGGSMKVQLSGQRAGLWADFAGEDRGDALDLWAKTRGISLSEAMAEAKGWLGIAEPDSPRKEYERPVKTGCRKLDQEGRAAKYLREERKLMPDVLKAYKVTQDEKSQGYYLPSFDRKGVLIQLKWIGLQRKGGKKVVRTGTGCAPCLFGWQAIDNLTKAVVICEGEVDAMTWAQWGFPALSVPFGAKNLDWIDYEWENLEPFDDIYLAFDDDEAGREGLKDIVRRIGMHRCRIVELPCKDANEWHVKNCPDESQVGEVMARAKYIEPAQFTNLTRFIAKAVEDLKGRDQDGLRHPIFDGLLAFRPGETTIWSGYPGHGKSTLISQVMVWTVTMGHRVAIASMEMPIHRQLNIMARQFYARIPTEEELTRFIHWLNERAYILDLYGMVKASDLMNLMEYANKRYGCTVGVVDSLMKLDLSTEDYEAQRKALNEMTLFAMVNRMHLHIVAHPRKSEKDTNELNMLDVRGSQDIIAQPDNVLLVQRNKRKEKSGLSGADGWIICDKQRSTGTVFKQEIKWHPEALQYAPNKEHETSRDYSYAYAQVD